MLRGGLLIGILLIAGCSDICANNELAQAFSPDQRHTAIMFERNCGATTGSSIQISILKSGKAVSGTGNIFVADSGHGAVLDQWSGPLADAVWLSSDHLLIRYAAHSRIFRRVDQVNEITVRYEQVNP